MKKRTIYHVLVGLGFFLASVICSVCSWTSLTFGVGLDEIIFTLAVPMKGANMSPVLSAMKYCLPRILLVSGAYAFFAVMDTRSKFSVKILVKLKKRIAELELQKILRPAVAIASVVAILLSLVYCNKTYDFTGYIKSQNSLSTIYEDYYVDPESVTFTVTNENGEYKNLIYIFLESMETTYTSKENGGNQEVCHIPNLVSLAKENVSFSNKTGLGGFHNTVGTGYTMGSLLSITSGVPFSFPVYGNSMNEREVFASGLTTLGDILGGLGYKQEFLCGSDAAYAGRYTYFRQHGNYEVFDLFVARRNGYVPEDYFEFWGFEDKYLYQIAKDELTKLSAGDEPFNFTMLTVDPHHTEGYLCDICPDTYPTQTENVVACADSQLGEFIDWCKNQPFFEDTVIVISGDHPRMDPFMVEGVDDYERTVYNCFIGSEKEASLTSNRTFASIDMFPTTLSAMGFSWGGSRLGLGTDMFSGEQTLAEQLGFEYLDAELAKKSQYYIKNFY